MQNQKATLITIVVSLLIFTPLTVISAFIKEDKNPLDKNPKHEFFYKGFLWFYDENDKFLSKYECLTETCDFTKTVIDDTNYGINYYEDGKKEKVSIIDDRYTFITDGAIKYLVNVATGGSLQAYKEVKNYYTHLDNNIYIIKNSDDVWGALSVGSVLSPVLPFEYDFIGLTNNMLDDNILATDKFIVKKNNKWYLVDKNNSALSGYFDDPIINYTDNYIITKNNKTYRIFTYQNYEYLSNMQIVNCVVEGNFIGVVSNNMLYIYQNNFDNYLNSYSLNNQSSKIELNKVSNGLEIKVDGKILETLAINSVF